MRLEPEEFAKFQTGEVVGDRLQTVCRERVGVLRVAYVHVHVGVAGGVRQTGIPQARIQVYGELVEPSLPQVGPREVRPERADTPEIRAVEIRSRQVEPRDILVAPVSARRVDMGIASPSHHGSQLVDIART